MGQITWDIDGLQEAQAQNNRIIAALRPSGAYGRAVQLGLVMAHRGTVARTHVESGTLRAAQRMRLEGLEGVVYTDPNAVNPNNWARASQYEFWEQERGGEHAAKRNTVERDGQSIARAVALALINEFP